MAKLQEIVAAMDKPEHSLAESLSSYQEGIKLVQECQQALEHVEASIKKISADGNIEEFKLDEDSD